MRLRSSAIAGISALAIVGAIAIPGVASASDGSVSGIAGSLTGNGDSSGAGSPDPSVIPSDNSTPEEVSAIKESATDGGAASTEEVRDGRLLTSYEVSSPEGLEATVVTNEPDPNSVQPRIRVGVGWGVYLYLNRVDQGALASGGAAGLSIIACALPGVNIVGCAAVSAGMAAAAYYISQYGFCSNEMEITLPQATVKCV